MPANKEARPLPSPWKEFLGDLDRMLREPLELHCIGGFALTRTTGDIERICQVAPIAEHKKIQNTIRHFVDKFLLFLDSTQNDEPRITFTFIHLIPAFGKHRLREIGTVDLQQFGLQKMKSGLSWESANHFRNLMSKLSELPKKWNCHCGENPAVGVALPEKVPVREKHVLTPDQIPPLLELLKEPARTMVLLGILTGMRVGEILGLRRRDVDFISGHIKIEQSNYRGVIGSPKTKGSSRSLPISNGLVVPLARMCGHRARTEDESFVFQSCSGRPLNDSNLLHRHLKPAGRKLGAPWLNWHTLRRTHATLLQVSGASLRDAQAQLGHSKMSTRLEIYTLPIPAHLREAVENLSPMVTSSPKLRRKELPLLNVFNEIDGRPVGTRFTVLSQIASVYAALQPTARF